MSGIAWVSAFEGSQNIWPGAGSTSSMVRDGMVLRERDCTFRDERCGDDTPIKRLRLRSRSVCISMTCHIYHSSTCFDWADVRRTFLNRRLGSWILLVLPTIEILDLKTRTQNCSSPARYTFFSISVLAAFRLSSSRALCCKTLL